MTALNYTDIKQYILGLSQPNPHLHGHAICPYIKPYIDNITHSTHNTPQEVLEHVPHVIEQNSIAHVMVCAFDWDWFEMESTVQILHHQHQRQDKEFLFMHPDSEDAPLPIEDYSFQHPLIIVQIRSKLLEARKQLPQNTNYYDTFNKLK